MAEVSILGGVIQFLQVIGIYDVVIPFLLVFTLTFAIFERTKILGVEKPAKDVEYTKKSLNAMAAFCIAFLVIASSQLVEILLKVSAQMIVVLFAAVFLLMLIGTFLKEGELSGEGVTNVYARWALVFLVAIPLLAIFLNAIKADNGRTYLEIVWAFVLSVPTSPATASIVLIVAMILFMYFISKGKTAPAGNAGRTP